MRVGAQKNQQLLGQYGFLQHIVRFRLEPHVGEIGDSSCLRIDDLSIKVEKADGDLMYRQAYNVGLGEHSYLIGTQGGERNKIGKQGEYLFAIDAAGYFVRRVNWPRSREEARGKRAPYGYHALWGREVAEGHLTDCLYDEVKYLVWVTVKTWHTPTGDSNQPFGECCTRLMRVTIYGTPDEGFEALNRNANVYDNLHLSSDVLIEGTLKNDRDIVAISGHLDELCCSFQDEVFFNGMKDILDTGESRGASGQFGATKILAAELCGYDRVMLQNNTCWITYQLRPEGNSMYVLGCGGTLPRIRGLTRSAIDAWKDQKNREKFLSDKNVHVI
jgi:hypothetical protein